MNAWALITCLYLVIVLPSFMKWLQIRAVKWIHSHLCFTASIQGKNHLQWQALLQSEHVSITVLISICLTGNGRQCGSAGVPGGAAPLCHGYVPRCAAGSELCGEPAASQAMATRLSSPGNAVYNELLLSEIKLTLFRNRRGVQMLLSWHCETLFEVRNIQWAFCRQ